MQSTICFAFSNAAKRSSNTHRKIGSECRYATSHVQPSTEDAPPTAQRPRRLKVSELLAGQREAILEHSGQDYRLRITASGKLILTK